MTNELVTVEKRITGRPRSRSFTKVQPRDLWSPWDSGKTFKEAQGRAMTVEEAMLYLAHKMKSVTAITRDWEEEARYCGVSQQTMIEWRKVFFRRVKVDLYEVKAELDSHLRRAIKRAALAADAPIPDDLTSMERAFAEKVRLDAVRTLTKAMEAYTSFTEKWGLKDKDMAPEIERVATAEVSRDDLDKMADDVLLQYNKGMLTKSQKPEGI